jgi:hypothetical protein
MPLEETEMIAFLEAIRNDKYCPASKRISIHSTTHFCYLFLTLVLEMQKQLV